MEQPEMNPDITPLIRARNALKASEDAERNGDMALALRHANEAVAFSAQWRASIMGEQSTLDSVKGKEK
jgi:hypothetical protein